VSGSGCTELADNFCTLEGGCCDLSQVNVCPQCSNHQAVYMLLGNVTGTQWIHKLVIGTL